MLWFTEMEEGNDSLPIFTPKSFILQLYCKQKYKRTVEKAIDLFL